MADGCEADLSNLWIQNSTKVGPPPETMVGSVRVWNLRNCKKIVIPEGTERIGNHWFYRCSIVSVEIPASVKYIDANAFYNCESLKRVAFAEGSRLVKIGFECFSNTGIETITISRDVEEIQDSAFYRCEQLK